MSYKTDIKRNQTKLIINRKTHILKIEANNNKTCKTKGGKKIHKLYTIRVITKLPNSEQSYKGKVKTHK